MVLKFQYQSESPERLVKPQAAAQLTQVSDSGFLSETCENVFLTGDVNTAGPRTNALPYPAFLPCSDSP